MRRNDSPLTAEYALVGGERIDPIAVHEAEISAQTLLSGARLYPRPAHRRPPGLSESRPVLSASPRTAPARPRHSRSTRMLSPLSERHFPPAGATAGTALSLSAALAQAGRRPRGPFGAVAPYADMASGWPWQDQRCADYRSTGPDAAITVPENRPQLTRAEAASHTHESYFGDWQHRA